MKKHGVMFVLSTLLFVSVGCGDKSTNSSSDFSNSLILGKGMSGFNIIDETTSFSDSTTIYWRLEGEDDMAGSPIEIQISKASTGGYQVVYTFPFSNPQSYGHIMLSSFYHTFGKGSFRATGKLTTGNKTVATRDYAVQ
jgi:hypothetical protein